MVSDIRKALDAIAERAGWSAGAIRSKQFRHTYTAARLQTLDRGHPVAPFTVDRELGHTSTSMVEKVYAKLGQVRHRSEVVEHRIAQHLDHAPARKRLEALRAVT
jgi:integrase